MLTDLEAAAPPQQHWSWKIITLWSLGIVFAAVIAVLAYDEKLEPYDDLTPLRTTTPDSRTNGYILLKERWENLPKPSVEQKTRLDNIRKGIEPWDAAFSEQLRSGREHLTDNLKAALLLPEFVTPIVLKFSELSTKSETWIVHPYRLLLLEMETQRRAGNWKTALALRRDVQELARRNVEGSHSLIALLVGVSLNSMLIEDTCNLLEREKPDASQAAELADQWLTDLPITPAWAEAMKVETALSCNGIKVLKEGLEVVPEYRAKAWERLLLKENKTINRLHEQRRQLIREAFRILPSAPVSHASDGSESSRWLRYVDANYTGKKFMDGASGYRLIIAGLTDSALFRPRALRVGIAIYRWRLQHPGAWPATLQELVPEFLPAVPADPWNGQPLTWDMGSKTISAVGSDWLPGPVKFDKQNRSWFSGEHESPGLRLEIPPAPPSKALPSKSVKKTKPVLTAPALSK